MLELDLLLKPYAEENLAAMSAEQLQLFLVLLMFIVSLLLTCTFALIWSFLQSSGVSVASDLFFILFIIAATFLFGGVLWSKFAHMFFKPAAAFQKRVTKADGSREYLPADFDLTSSEVQTKFPDIPEYMGTNPPEMGLGIKRESPSHY